MPRSGRLASRYGLVATYTGRVLLGVAACMAVPLLALPAFPEEGRTAGALFAGSLVTLVVGMFLGRVGHTEGRVEMREGGLIVLASWLLAILLSALPFVFAGTLTPLNALFETTSGWTTTGLSVMDVRTTGSLFLLWRSIMQLVGGAGFAVVMLAALVGPPGVGLASAEGRGDQLLPNVQRSMLLVLRIYGTCVLVGFLGYVLAGMPAFDAVNHAFCALSTGGFSTRVESIGAYRSVGVELVTLVLMLLGTTNFAVLWALARGKLRPVLRNGEVRLGVFLTLVFVPLVLGTAVVPHHSGLRALRIGVFETLSAISTTGFSTVGYGDWPPAAVGALILLMLIGGGTCSTAGGLKLHRAYVLLRAVGWQLWAHVLPERAVLRREVWKGEEALPVGSEDVERVATFLVLFLGTYAAGVLVIAAHGYSLRDSLFEFASCIGTVGLSIGVTAPDSPALVRITQMAGMLLGRLEFFVVLYALLDLANDFGSALRRDGDHR